MGTSGLKACGWPQCNPWKCVNTVEAGAGANAEPPGMGVPGGPCTAWLQTLAEEMVMRAKWTGRNGERLAAAGVCTGLVAVWFGVANADLSDDNPERAVFEPPSRDVWPATTNPGTLWDACLDQPWVSGMERSEDGAISGRIGAAPSTLEQVRMVINADQAESRGNGGGYTLRGNASLQQGDRWIGADEMRLVGQRVDAEGAVLYADSELSWAGQRAFLRLNDGTGEIASARYFLSEQLGQGEAGRVELQGRDLILLENATYSTCSPASQIWQLQVSTLLLDQETGVGEAWNPRLAVLGVPVAYLPYLSFPLDDRRKTGLLQPSFGDSRRNGTELTLPYYFNIAPNVDATLTPRIITERGIQVGGEFRFLTRQQRGTVVGSILPGDDLADRDRWEASLEHDTTLAPGLTTRIDLHRVSDADFFRDLGSSADQSNVSHLRSRIEASFGSGGNWESTLSADDYQSLVPTQAERSRPYERLPEFTTRFAPDIVQLGALPVQFELAGSAVRFGHPSDDERDTATRLDLTPRISLPMRQPAGFLEPALSLRQTSYDLDRAETVGPSSVSRSLPVFSVDSGIYLDRYAGEDRRYRQSLEPRLFYLYVPEEDQNAIPRFDTARSSASLAQLFTENRFSGADRVGDANQLSMSLTSRLLDRQRGNELISGEIGQVIYFDDRRVQLGGDDAVEDRETSELFAEGRLRLPMGFTASGTAVWDPEESLLREATTRLRYEPAANARLSGSYRFRQDLDGETTQELLDLSASWPISAQWHAIAGWTYSSLESRTLQSIGGLQYQSCCWAVRVVNQAYRGDEGDPIDRAIMVQFELRGLGALGDRLEDYL